MEKNLIPKLKKNFQKFKHRGINLWPAMVLEVYTYEIFKKNEGNLLVRILKILRCLFLVNKFNIVGNGKNKIMASYPLDRKDHHNLFLKTLGAFTREKRILIDNYELKKRPVILRSYFNFPDLKLIYKIWKYFRRSSLKKLIRDRYYYFIAQTYFKCKQIDISYKLIKKYKPRAYLNYFSGSGDESIFIQICQKEKIPTFSIQHGIFLKPKSKFGWKQSSYEGMFEDYFLVWGGLSYKFARDFIGIKENKLAIVGNPKCERIRKSKEKFSPKKCAVFLSWGMYRENSLNLIKILDKFSKEHPEIKFYFKMHPASEKKDIKECRSRVGENFQMIDKNFEASELLEKADFVILHHSTTYLNSLGYQVPIFRYIDEDPLDLSSFLDYMPEKFTLEDGFGNYEELEDLFTEMFNQKKYKNLLNSYRTLYHKHFYQPKGKSIPEYYKEVIDWKVKEYVEAHKS